MSISGFIWFEPIQLTQRENEKKRDEKQRKYTLIKKWYFCKHICYVTKNETYYISYVTIFGTWFSLET